MLLGIVELWDWVKARHNSAENRKDIVKNQHI